MYLHPEYPSHKRLIESRDNVLAGFPGLNMVGAHLGSLEWDVDELAKRLDKYPNFAVDLAARVCHFQIQNREKVRKFVIRYQDRLLYATDFSVPEAYSQDKLDGIQSEWRSDWLYFATDEVMESRSVEVPFTGLDLDKKVLKKLFYSNAVFWYTGIFQ